MRVHIARSVFQTMATLEQAVQTDRSARALGQAWLSQQFQITMETHLQELREASALQSQALERFIVSQRERREQVAQLVRLVRDFYQVLKRRGLRQGNGDPVAVLYTCPKRVPHSAPIAQWLEWAKAIDLGEQQALEQGYPPMVNPSAQDIKRVLTRATASQIQWSQDQQTAKTEEQRLRNARSQASHTLRGLARRLREVLAHEPAATRRELMRTYGFSFISTGAPDRSPGHPEQSIFKNPPQAQPKPSLIALEPARATPNENKEPSHQESERSTPRESKPPLFKEVETSAHSEPNPKTAPAPSPTPDDPPISAKAAPSPLPQPGEPNEDPPTRDQQLKPATELESPAAPKKLSRRQKKALRRAAQAKGTSPSQAYHPIQQLGRTPLNHPN